ncbi:hypothetical protein [Lactobacillus sp. wkB10]|uniref:hypothetical protein n=1 Tax=Lactobacillus sp. wkB10 TaxID=1545701 RepID=UPI00051431E1|nr:hypothetical protein [Lactobacillus sp. wkB10]KGG53984.1 hypothetical protein LACWKB10_1204 [Lactobacillus sp. wkB10]
MAENKETKGFIQVYKSTNTIPCEPWFAPADAEIAYPYVKDAPDPKLKAPKYDWNNYRLYETDGAVQGQKISEMADTLNKLKDDVANGKLSNEALNQQLGTLVGLVSQGAVAQQTSSDKADSAAKSDGGAK